ncbi:hypothetical protein QVD17_03550 [Tagetes erecta]|uniref:Uncharacterized protein n=1 Tax=Tagetes erecta TaxID=13708 RepID=A0AAD8LA60_TARER|nr:hypothetical protein QVD17_03550 [Tagetes erecta]
MSRFRQIHDNINTLTNLQQSHISNRIKLLHQCLIIYVFESELIMDTVSIRVPYKNLKHDADADATVEMLQFHNSTLGNCSTSSSSSPLHGSPTQNCSLIMLILSCTVAAGVQFGWALQLSLLTPYIQTLGIGHAFSSFIWLCGPITGLVIETHMKKFHSVRWRRLRSA